jgi:hypothetical protein
LGFFPDVLYELSLHTCQSVTIVVLYNIDGQSGKTDKQTDRHTVKKKRIIECQQQQAMLCYERVLFAIYILSLYRSSSSTMMMDIPRCKRMAGG